MSETNELHPGERNRPSAAETGSALVLVLIFAVMLSAVIIALVTAVNIESKSGVQKRQLHQALSSADTAMAKAIVLAQQQYSTYDSYSTLTQILPSTGTWADTVYEDGGKAAIENLDGATDFPYTFRIRARGVVGGDQREIEVILLLDKDQVNLSIPGLGAVVGNGDITVNGNIEIDGRDHNPDGSLRVDPGAQDVPGVNVTGALDHSGSATIGGNGTAPGNSSTAGEGEYDTQSTVWDPEDGLASAIASDGLDNDGDTAVDEASEPADVFASDGIDNDNDGAIDGADPDETDNPTDNSYDIGNWENDSFDNDGDGMVDEDGFPDVSAHLVGKVGEKNDEHFIEAAKAGGTYFRYDGSGNGAKLRAWVTGDGDGAVYHSGQLYSDWVGSADASDGGDIVYVQGRPNSEISGSYTDFGGFTLPDNGQATNNPTYEPTLFIMQSSSYGDKDFDGDYDDNHNGHNHHEDDNEGVKVGPLKVKGSGPNDGTFIGVFIADTIQNTNGNGQIIGSVFAFNADDSTIFGNGNFKIKFSSAVIGSIADPDNTNQPQLPPVILLWREVK